MNFYIVLSNQVNFSLKHVCKSSSHSTSQPGGENLMIESFGIFTLIIPQKIFPIHDSVLNMRTSLNICSRL